LVTVTAFVRQCRIEDKLAMVDHVLMFRQIVLVVLLLLVDMFVQVVVLVFPEVGVCVLVVQGLRIGE
jgi:hypothetical protein